MRALLETNPGEIIIDSEDGSSSDSLSNQPVNDDDSD